MARSLPPEDEGRDLPDRPVGSVLRGLLGRGRFREGVDLGRLARAWIAVAGAELAAETAPMALDRGSLVVAASSPAWRARADFAASDIARRANETLGRPVVESVRVRVGPNRRKPLWPKG